MKLGVTVIHNRKFYNLHQDTSASKELKAEVLECPCLCADFLLIRACR